MLAFIVDLKYIVPIEELEKHMGEHVKYLDKYYKKNVFIASGRKVPRTGGFIVALADSKEHIEGVIKEDPFYKHQLAEISINEVLPTKYHPDLMSLLNH